MILSTKEKRQKIINQVDNFDAIVSSALEVYSDMVEQGMADAKRLDEIDRDGGRYEPILKNSANAQVSRLEAQDLFLDLSRLTDNAAEKNWCVYCMLSVPGKFNCEAGWIVEHLRRIKEPPRLGVDYQMPAPSIHPESVPHAAQNSDHPSHGGGVASV